MKVSELEKDITFILKQAEYLDTNALYAGLTLMSKTYQTRYMSATTTEGVDGFFNMALNILNDDRASHPNSPLWNSTVHQKITLVNPIIDEGIIPEEYLNGSIIHEWTLEPGKKLFDKFAAKFKEVICGKDGPYQLFNNGLLKQSELPVAIVGAILTTGFAVATVWIPLAVYITLLIIKTGLKVYCEV